jgi:hypothetical protein
MLWYCFVARVTENNYTYPEAHIAASRNNPLKALATLPRGFPVFIGPAISGPWQIVRDGDRG